MVDSISSIASGRSVEQVRQSEASRDERENSAVPIRRATDPIDQVEISEQAVKRYAQDARSELSASPDQTLGLDRNFDVSV